MILRKKEIELQFTAVNDTDDVANELKEYAKSKRCSLETSPIKYLADRKKSHKELYELFLVTNSVPITQVSVERAFSSLAFILSPARNSLASDTLENILLVRLNREIFLELPLIHEDGDN